MVTYIIKYRFKDKSNPQYLGGHWYIYAFCGNSEDQILQSCINSQLKNLHRDWKNREFKVEIVEKFILKNEEAIYNYGN